jgi:hypothetical protein
MQTEWEEIDLEIGACKNTGTYVLRASDEIIQKLDDDMTSTTVMAFAVQEAFRRKTEPMGTDTQADYLRH